MPPGNTLTPRLHAHALVEQPLRAYDQIMSQFASRRCALFCFECGVFEDECYDRIILPWSKPIRNRVRDADGQEG